MPIYEVSLLLLYSKLKSMNNDGIVELNLSESESDHGRFGRENMTIIVYVYRKNYTCYLCDNNYAFCMYNCKL